MLDLESAVAQILADLPAPQAVNVPPADAAGRVLAAPVSAATDLPPFDNSSMDGYAIRSADVASATHKAPSRLRLAGRTPAGETFAGELASGACVRLFTGSPIPRGADAVVMQEETRLEPNRPGEVLVLESVKPWENVRFRGEDVKRGTALAEPGEIVTAGRINLFAAAGVQHVSVGRQPLVALLATGSELREPGEPLGPGQIHESNRAGLAALVRNTSAVPKIYPIVPDDRDQTRAALERTFAECDLVITCGGVSVGEMDFVKAAFEQLGGKLQFWKVAIKPGRPFVFGRLREKFLFGLPGNPVSALVTFLLLVRPALLRWQGAKEAGVPTYPGVLAEPLVNGGNRRHFMRVTMNPAGQVRSAGIQASHILSSVAVANGLVDVPPQTTLAAGATVSVLRWE